MTFQFTVRLDDDRKTVEIAFPDAPAGAKLAMTGEALSEFIDALAKVRKSMLPEPPVLHDQSKPFVASEFPSWHVDRDLMHGYPALHLRHAGFGWQHYLIHHQVAVEMGQWLVKFGEMGPSDQAVPPSAAN